MADLDNLGPDDYGNGGGATTPATGLDPSLVKAVKGFEGFSPTSQWDYKQHSNGYGTKAMYPGETIDRNEADSRLQDELYKAKTKVEGLGVPMTPGQKNALTSLTFNAGDGWMNQGLGQAVKNQDWDTAAQHFLQYNKAGGETNSGLANRRATEASWFSSAPIISAFNKGARALGINIGGNNQASPMSQAMQPGQPDQSQQPQQATGAGPGKFAQGLEMMGDPMQRAAAWLMAVNHPEALSALGSLNQGKQLNRPVWGVVGEKTDPMTGATVKQYGWINANQQTINGQPSPGGSMPSVGAGQAPQSNMGDAVRAARASNPTAAQDDLIKTLPQDMQGEVAAVLEGRGSTMNLPPRSPMRASILMAAHEIDPQFDEATWKQRSEFLNKYGNAGLGQFGGQVNAGNKATGHLANLSDFIVAADPSDIGGTVGSSIANRIRGLTTTQASKNNKVDQAAMALADEMNKLYSGTGQGVNQREKMAQLFDHTKSKTELIGAIEAAHQMINEQLGTLGGQRDAVYGGRDMESKMPVFRSKDQEAKINANLDKLRGNTTAGPAGNAVPAGGATRPPLSSIFGQ